MKPFGVCVFFVVNFIACILAQCIYPPCSVLEHQHLEEEHPEEQCCSQQKREIDAVHRNLTAIWYTISEFKEVVSNHLQHLHEHQIQIYAHQTGSKPRYPHFHDDHHDHGPPSSRQGHTPQDHHHHHQDRSPQEYRPTLVGPEPPVMAFFRHARVRNPEDFDFATCEMIHNPASTLGGIVYFTQKKNSDTLYIHIMMSGFNASATPIPENQLGTEEEPFYLHGVHVHETADFSRGCESTGPHYNPFKRQHGGPDSSNRHVGDFGNVPSDSQGAIHELITDETASLRGKYSIIGKSLVIHALEDDLGENPDDPGSISSGNSGARLACCVIRKQDVKIPSYRRSKPAKHEEMQQVIEKVHKLFN